MLDIPQKYYEEEGFLSLMGLGYTSALAVTGFGAAKLLGKEAQEGGFETLRPYFYIFFGGIVVTWGFLDASGVLY